MSEPAVHIVYLSVELHLPSAQSLKEKRMIVKSLKDRIRNQFNVSVAEVDELDMWQKCGMGAVMLSNDKAGLDSSIQAVLRFIESQRDLQVLDSNIQFL